MPRCTIRWRWSLSAKMCEVPEAPEVPEVAKSWRSRKFLDRHNATGISSEVGSQVGVRETASVKFNKPAVSV